MYAHLYSQVAADVFGAEVLVADTPDAAAVGAARRAAHGLALASRGVDAVGPFSDFIRACAGRDENLAVAARPRAEAAAAYDAALVERFRRFEDRVAAAPAE